MDDLSVLNRIFINQRGLCDDCDDVTIFFIYSHFLLLIKFLAKDTAALSEYGALLEPLASVRIEPPKSVRLSH